MRQWALTRSMMPYSLACHGSKYLGRWMSFAIVSGSVLVCRASSDTCGRRLEIKAARRHFNQSYLTLRMLKDLNGEARC